MATTFTVRCVVLGKATQLKIIDSLNPFPGSDSWAAEEALAWGMSDGPAAIGQRGTSLYGAGVTPIATLDGLTGSTSLGDSGKGNKNTPDGWFPSGDFTWVCVSRT